MPLINALLVRWSGGWAEITDDPSIAANGRREGYLDLGAQASVSEATRLGRAHMAESARVRTETAVDVAPVSASDTPYASFTVGDRVSVPNWQGAMKSTRVTALGGAVDENGSVSFSVDVSELVE